MYLKLYVTIYSSPTNTIAFVKLGSGSAQLFYHLRPDLLSTLFRSTLRPISSANKWPKPYHSFTAVQIPHYIILPFVLLSSYWLHGTCLKYKLYILGGQREERKPLEGRRGRWRDNIKVDVKYMGARGNMVGFVLFRIGKSAGLLCTRQWTFLFYICWLAVELLASPEALCCIQFAVCCRF